MEEGKGKKRNREKGWQDGRNEVGINTDGRQDGGKEGWVDGWLNGWIDG